MTAAAEGQLEVVRLLLEHGANPGLKDKDGDTAESFAQREGPHRCRQRCSRIRPRPSN